MSLEKFTKDALRTESKVEEVIVNELLLTTTIQSLISMGNILDQIKKHVFYDKPYDISAIRMHFSAAEEAMSTFATLNPNEITEDERVINVNPRIFHGVVGISTEATELLEALDLYSRDLDNTNLGEECFDASWYIAVLLDELGIDWQQGLNTVIAKLRHRYPEKFESTDAISRDLDTERKILEDGFKSSSNDT